MGSNFKQKRGGENHLKSLKEAHEFYQLASQQAFFLPVWLVTLPLCASLGRNTIRFTVTQ